VTVTPRFTASLLAKLNANTKSLVYAVALALVMASLKLGTPTITTAAAIPRVNISSMSVNPAFDLNPVFMIGLIPCKVTQLQAILLEILAFLTQTT
jgi:hypothetical protein